MHNTQGHTVHCPTLHCNYWNQKYLYTGNTCNHKCTIPAIYATVFFKSVEVLWAKYFLVKLYALAKYDGFDFPCVVTKPEKSTSIQDLYTPLHRHDPMSSQYRSFTHESFEISTIKASFHHLAQDLAKHWLFLEYRICYYFENTQVI